MSVLLRGYVDENEICLAPPPLPTPQQQLLALGQRLSDIQNGVILGTPEDTVNIRAQIATLWNKTNPGQPYLISPLTPEKQQVVRHNQGNDSFDQQVAKSKVKM